MRVQGGFSMRRLNVCVLFCSPPFSTLLHTTQHTRLTWSGRGRVALAFRWRVRRLDVSQPWPSGWWIEQQLMMSDTRIAVICGEQALFTSNLLSPLPPNSLASLGVSGRSLQACSPAAVPQSLRAALLRRDACLCGLGYPIILSDGLNRCTIQPRMVWFAARVKCVV